VSCGAALFDTGRQVLPRLLPELDQADPMGTIQPAARLLCCGLAELASQVHVAVTGVVSDDVVLTAARLALLTKLDDEVIDSLAFHGGSVTPRPELRRHLWSYLRPTLESIQTGRARTPEPRCQLAARVGLDLQRLAASPERLASQLRLIARGWQIQVDGVVTLSSRPADVTEAQVRRDTRAISGAWLAMVTAVGWLPAAAPRWCSADELDAFFDWGEYIQAADALADLDKEVPDGLGCSLPVYLAWRERPELVQAALKNHNVQALRGIIVATGVDACASPNAQVRVGLGQRLRHMGAVPDTLGWVHGFLMARYSEASADRAPPSSTDWRDWRSTHGNDAVVEGSCLVY
jgi:hypothetical protein